MIYSEGDVRRTFNDYRDEDGMSLQVQGGRGPSVFGRSSPILAAQRT